MTADAELRALERAAQENPSDEWARYRWRSAAIRAGGAFEPGDQASTHCVDAGESYRGVPGTVVGRKAHALVLLVTTTKDGRSCFVDACGHPEFWTLLAPGATS